MPYIFNRHQSQCMLRWAAKLTAIIALLSISSTTLATKVYREVVPDMRATADYVTTTAQGLTSPTTDGISTNTMESVVIADLVLLYTNQERQKAGLPPVLRDAPLAQLADAHSNDMATRGYFSHGGAGDTGPGVGFGERVNLKQLGYKLSGENIALQPIVKSRRFATRTLSSGKVERVETSLSASSDEIARGCVENWMKSPGHRKNILTPEFNLIGVGASAGERDGTPYAWITQIFAQN